MRDSPGHLQLSDRLVALLREHSRGLTVRGMRSRLSDSPSTVLIENALTELTRDGVLQRIRGAHWRLSPPASTASEPSTSSRATHQAEDENHGESSPATTYQPSKSIPGGQSRWAEFRQLCHYYCECLRIEASQKVCTYADKAGERFTSLASGAMQTLVRDHRAAIRVQKSWSQLVRYLVSLGLESHAYIGGPVHVYIGLDRDTGETYRRLQPLFISRMHWERHDELLHLRGHDRWEVNHGWLERQFKKPDERRTFLQIMGLADLTPSDAPALPTLVHAVQRYYPEWWQEPADVTQPTEEPSLDKVRKSGVYNRYILVAQPKLKYTWRLVRELQDLAERPDSELDRSALAYLFPHDKPSASPAADQTEKPGSASHRDEAWARPAEIEPLNLQQREACERAATEPISVVKGPPGTGKSRVVTQVMADAAMRGRPTLFASRNHQAITAVAPGLNAVTEPDPVVLNLAHRANQGDAPPSLLRAVTEVLGQPKPAGAAEQREANRKKVRQRFAEVDDLLGQLQSVADQSDQIDAALSELAMALSSLPIEAESTIWGLEPSEAVGLASPEALEATADELSRWERRLPGWAQLAEPVCRWWFRRQVWPRHEPIVNGFERTFHIDTDRHAQPDPPQAVSAVRYWLDHARAVTAANTVQHHRQDLQSRPAWGECLQRLQNANALAIESARHCLQNTARALGTDINGEDHQALAEIRAELEMASSSSSQTEQRRLNKLLQNRVGMLLEHLPLWATTNLSAGRDLPMAPGLFDLLIIDEASQCDIPSVVPLLFRAKRAMVVGDPMQLPHITKLPNDTHQHLRQRFGLTDVSHARYMYTSNSCFDLVTTNAGTKAQTQLRNHHRSHPAIADYSNRAFYREQLNVVTDTDPLHGCPSNGRKRTGILWNHVTDDVESARSAGGGGAISLGQIDAIVEELRRLADAKYRGTVGVVTLFRQQANRLRDRVMEAFDSQPPEAWQFRVDTADGFQGGERDVMLFSLVGGTGLAYGSHRFLQEQPNRFNVAVSRARAVLHIFGDRAWAADCGIRHIEELVRSHDRQITFEEKAGGFREDLVGPVWEPRFANALREAELPIQQQYPVLGGRFYLDFALLREGKKLAIEVDGEAWHRDESGRRKNEDVSRDLTLIAAGWRVLRFWVYELRENMPGCVRDVKQAWNS